MIVQRWELRLASGWVVKYGMALGSMLQQVCLDLTDTKEGGGPQAFTGRTRVACVQDCFWQ